MDVMRRLTDTVSNSVASRLNTMLDKAVPSYAPIHTLMQNTRTMKNKLLIIDDQLDCKYVIKRAAESQGVEARFFSQMGDIPDDAVVIGVGRELLAIPHLRAFDILEPSLETISVMQNITGTSAALDAQARRMSLEAVIVANFPLRLFELFDAARTYVSGGDIVLDIFATKIFTRMEGIRADDGFHDAVDALIQASNIDEYVRTAA